MGLNYNPSSYWLATHSSTQMAVYCTLFSWWSNLSDSSTDTNINLPDPFTCFLEHNTHEERWKRIYCPLHGADSTFCISDFFQVVLGNRAHRILFPVTRGEHKRGRGEWPAPLYSPGVSDQSLVGSFGSFRLKNSVSSAVVRPTDRQCRLNGKQPCKWGGPGSENKEGTLKLIICEWDKDLYSSV